MSQDRFLYTSQRFEGEKARRQTFGLNERTLKKEYQEIAQRNSGIKPEVVLSVPEGTSKIFFDAPSLAVSVAFVAGRQ